MKKLNEEQMIQEEQTARQRKVIEKISDISTRMIVNKVSLKFKKDEIFDLVNKLEAVTGEEKC